MLLKPKTLMSHEDCRGTKARQLAKPGGWSKETQTVDMLLSHTLLRETGMPAVTHSSARSTATEEENLMS